MPDGHGAHGVAQPVHVEWAAQGDLELDRIQVVAALRCVGVKQQTLL